MGNNRITDYLTFFEGSYPKFRHLEPSVYKKIRNTKKFIQQGIHPNEFVNRGGVDIETYNTLLQIWQDKNEVIETNKVELNDKVEYVTPSEGPCKKINPVIGDKKALVLLIEFNDKKNSTPTQHFQDLLFNLDLQYSMKNYYLEASGNKLTIDGYVNDEWFVSNYDRSKYVDTNLVNGRFIKAQNLVREAVQAAKTRHDFNFSDFAKDGEIELLIVIYAGSGMDTKLDAKFIRPHTDVLEDPIEVEEGIWAKNYSIIPELPIDDVGIFCHETGHHLGLPDLYKDGYSTIVGGWCLMGVGDQNNGGRTPALLSAWCKIYLGWTTPKTITGKPQVQTIPAVNHPDNYNEIYKIFVTGTNGKEYFLIENRQQKGFDQGLPASGILIWHINENQCLYSEPNHDPKHFFLTLVQSDGIEELREDMLDIEKSEGQVAGQKDLTGDNGDPFPGVNNVTSFDDTSNPNSKSYDNRESCVVVNSISNSDLIMTANMGITCSQKNMQEISTPNISAGINAPKIVSQQIKSSQTNPIMITPDMKPFVDHPPIDDCTKIMNEKTFINHYQNGYKKGFKKGYLDAIKDLKE